ncbi:hypothetical protein LP420_38290 [Massilia sp. B-10]|nr:hypothetical protein LP420_38290 [Massilia sp. B-10]
MPFRQRLVGLALEGVGAAIALDRAGELLHNADPAHGHEIVGQGKAVRARHWKIVDANLEYRIWQLAGRHRHLARGGNGRIDA